MSDFDFESAYKVDGYDGVAWRACRHPETLWIPGWLELPDGQLVEDEEDGEFVENTDLVVCVMIGDNREFEFEIDELTKISDDEFCSSCGQLGCQHDGR